MSTLDHLDPVWFEPGKEDQEICGLDLSCNYREVDISENSRKSDRFLPYRFIGDQLPPCQSGDLALFLVNEEWCLIPFLGDEWYAETTRRGNYHQARMGRKMAEEEKGFIQWRSRQTEEVIQQHEQNRIQGIRNAVASGKKWGFMLLDPKENAARGGKVSGNMKYMDPDHPELGVHNPGNLVQKQRRAGLPSGKENRVRVRFTTARLRLN